MLCTRFLDCDTSIVFELFGAKSLELGAKSLVKLILIRTILVINRTLFFRIVWTPLPTQRSSPSWKNLHRVILLWWWLTELVPFEPLSAKCSQTHWWQCAGFTANMLVKDTWVSIPLVRTLPYSHYFLFVSGKLKSQFPHIFKEILEDLEQFRNYVIDQEMFNVIWALLERITKKTMTILLRWRIVSRLISSFVISRRLQRR